MDVNDTEYYKKFPAKLKEALLSGKVKFTDTTQSDYADKTVYRGVKYTEQKQTITIEDFLSKIELKEKRPMIVADENNISSYSCSCFEDMKEMEMQAKFPRKNCAIAKGIISKNYGPIDVNKKTTHVDFYLYDNVDPSKEFEVIKVWEKNG